MFSTISKNCLSFLKNGSKIQTKSCGRSVQSFWSVRTTNKISFLFPSDGFFGSVSSLRGLISENGRRKFVQFGKENLKRENSFCSWGIFQKHFSSSFILSKTKFIHSSKQLFNRFLFPSLTRSILPLPFFFSSLSPSPSPPLLSLSHLSSPLSPPPLSLSNCNMKIDNISASFDKKASLFRRMVGYLIDAVIGFALCCLPCFLNPRGGLFLIFLYVSLRDCVTSYGSIGKRLTRSKLVQVVTTKQGRLTFESYKVAPFSTRFYRGLMIFFLQVTLVGSLVDLVCLREGKRFSDSLLELEVVADQKLVW